MLAIEKDFPAPEASLAAARAGATMLLICHTPDKQIAAIDVLAKAVDSDDISKETIESAIATISSVKRQLQFQTPASIGIEPQTSLSETIALDAVTIIKNEEATLPLKSGPSTDLAVVVPAFDALTKVEEAAEPHEVLLAELKRRHERINYVRASVEPSQAETDDCIRTCEEADTLIILTYNMHIYSSQAELVEALLNLGKPAVVAAVRDPYDLMLAQRARALVATYGFRACSLKALVKVLFGEAEARGRLPVNLGLPKN